MTLVPRLRPPRREQLPEWFACAFAAGVALLHPLIFDDFFFNINRFKFGVFAVSAYAGLIVFLLLCAARRRALAGEIRQPFSLSAADWGMGAFAVLAAASTILSDDAFSALTGDEGRLCGLVFILALAAMHVIVSRAQNADAWAVGGLLISGSLCALLGVLNFFKIDPFGFYPRLNQKSVDGFISTIGNVDFFSAFLCLFLPAAVAAFMRGGRWVRRLSVFPILLGTGAVIAARADGALIALASAILTALCLGALPLPAPSESRQRSDSAAPRLEANLAESAPCSEENDVPSRFRRTLSSLAASLHGKAADADEEKKPRLQQEARARKHPALAGSSEDGAPSRFRRTLSSLAASLHGKATGANEEKKPRSQREARARKHLALAGSCEDGAPSRFRRTLSSLAASLHGKAADADEEKKPRLQQEARARKHPALAGSSEDGAPSRFRRTLSSLAASLHGKATGANEEKKPRSQREARARKHLALAGSCEDGAPSRFRRTLSSLAASLHGKATGADEEKKLHPQREARTRMCLALACLMAGLFLVGAATRLWPDATLSLKDHACARLAAHPLLFAALSLLLTAAAYGLLHTRREKPVFPAPRAFLLTLLACAIVALAAAAALFLFYTYVDTDTKLTGMLKLFRFRDKWGTNRGGVWVRCMKLFAQSDWRVKLFGFGPDLLKKPLADAYGAEIAAYCNLSFNNAHNEYIQYLLTHGALGLTAYLTFAVGACASLFRRARKSAAAAGLLAGALAYLLHAAVNVNQPITTPLLFLFLSASVSVPTEPAPARKNPRAQRVE